MIYLAPLIALSAFFYSIAFAHWIARNAKYFYHVTYQDSLWLDSTSWKNRRTAKPILDHYSISYRFFCLIFSSHSAAKAACTAAFRPRISSFPGLNGTSIAPLFF